MNSTIFSPNKLVSISKRCALFVFAGLLLFLVTPVRATTLLNPLPEDSTTLFGFAVAPVGDVNGDAVSDLAVGEPFADGEFGDTEGFGPPQNVGRVFLISGATLSVIRPVERSRLSNGHR